MEIHRTQTINSRQPHAYPFAVAPEAADRLSPEEIEQQQRLNALLAINAEISREKLLYPTYREEVEAGMMRNPIPVKQAFAYFGLMLGALPPAAIFSKIFTRGSEEIGLIFLLVLVNLVCAVAGYFSGKLIGKIVLEVEKRSWNLMLVLLPLIGALWGIMTGGAGGTMVFVIGAFFGAFIAAVVGGIAVPAFTILHRLLKRGEMIERNQFLPLAMGITLIISAFILGL
jgi:hypothetical protein